MVTKTFANSPIENFLMFVSFCPNPYQIIIVSTLHSLTSLVLLVAFSAALSLWFCL